jgi:hypothetical protein
MVINAMSGVCESPSVYRNHALREIHQGTIRAHHAKKGYSYPTIHLPPSFSSLVGLRTHIFETVHDGAPAFLVVVSSSAAKLKKASESRCDPLLHTAEVGSPNLPGPIVFDFVSAGAFVY